jgi:hypothetical protein
VLFLGEEKKKYIDNKLNNHRRHVLLHQKEDMVALLTTLLKGVFKHQEVLHTSLQGRE